MEIAQAALAVLDVRFNLIAALASPACAIVAFGHFRIDELPRGACDDLGPESVFKFSKELRVAKDQAGIQKRGPYRDIGKPELQTLIDGARRVSDLETQIPKDEE